MKKAEAVKLQIDQAIANRDARVACLIAENIRNALETLDEQPAAVFEAMIEHRADLLVSKQPPNHRSGLRAALVEYLKERLQQARERERSLAEAVTGQDLPND